MNVNPQVPHHHRETGKGPDLNLYGFVGNDGANSWDYLGQSEKIMWRGEGASVGLGFLMASVGYYDYTLWSDCFKKDDGCCYKQEVYVQAVSFGLGVGIGVKLATGGDVRFIADKDKEWEAFKGGVTIQEAGSLTTFVEEHTWYSLFWLGSAKSLEIAEIDISREFGIDFTLVSKTTGKTRVTLKSEVECECE